jgi:hypothetical protein
VKRVVALVQGVYYITLGIWPLLSMSSFEVVSGPKTDHWLVRTVALLISLIGLVLLLAAMNKDMGASIKLLAVGSAAGLAFIEIFYAMRGIIWPIYMLDAIGEVVLIVMWMIAIVRDRGAIRTPVRHPQMS